MSSLADWFNRLSEAVALIPVMVTEGVKSIFIPRDGYIESSVAYLKDQFSSIGVVTYDMSAIMGKETPLANIDGTIYGQKVTFVNMDVVDYVVSHFRGVIRGFMWLMLIIYNYNQFMGLIGQQSLTLDNIIRSVGKGDTGE